MRKMLGVAALMCAGWVHADVIRVPCEEYVVVMKARMVCEAMPMVPVDERRWRHVHHMNCLKENGLRPWDAGVDAACGATSPDPVAKPPKATECIPGMPPWKQPKGLKCK